MSPHSAFAPLTDPAAVHNLLQAHVHDLVEAPCELLGCDVLHAWRKTYEAPSSWDKSYLNVCYRLRLAQRQPSPARPMLLHGTAYFRHRGEPAAAAGHAPVATLRLAQLDLALRRFPDDAALPQLALLTDTARLPEFVPAGVLQALASTRAVGERLALRGAALEVINYRAGERCTLRYDIALEAPARTLTLFAKTYKDAAGARVHQHLSELYARGGHTVKVAEPLGYHAATRTVWQRGERGAQAAELMQGERQSHAARALARSLAALHDSNLNYERVMLREQLLFEARKRANKLAAAYPVLEAALRALMERCAQDCAQLPQGQAAVLHGDAHINQFHIAGDEAIMFDFDELTYGDAEHDLANFIISLQLDVPPGEAIAAFLLEYRKHSARRIEPALLLWHYRMQLISKAYRAFWRQAPHADGVVVRALELACEQAPAWA